MKKLIPFFTALLIVLLSVGCNKDDDDNGGGGGTGGDVGDLTVTLTWDAVGIDLDLSLVDPSGGIAGGGFVFNSNAISSGDDLSGPGEETVTFDDNAPDGTYVVTVGIIDEDVSADYSLKIEASGNSRTFNQSIIDDTNVEDDGEVIITFTKTGGQLTF